MMRSLLLVALAGCGAEKPPPAALPGTLWFVDDAVPPTLVRASANVRTVIGPDLFPSAHALPDGRLVAIASHGDGEADSEQLALVREDGRVDRIGPTAAQVRDPAVDRRGRWIVVAANLDGHSDLYRIDLAGPVTRLTNDLEGNFHPALAGDSLVYVSSRDGNSELYRDAQRLTVTEHDDWEPTPSPDGNTLAFLSDRDGGAHIYLSDVDGTRVRRLAPHAGEESAPTWSRDGSQLAYVVAGQVWVHSLATGGDRRVTPDGTIDSEPTFSPDGRWLAVSRTRGDTSDLWAIALDADDTVLIAQHARLPRWR